MNKGNLDRVTFEAIEAYVLDRMSTVERTAFEQRLANDTALRAELELERENIQAVELGGLTSTLRSIASDLQATERAKGTGWGRFMAYAASIAVLLMVTIWWFGRPPINERLFADHFTPEPGLPVTMGATDDPAFADAMVYYKEGLYAEAAARWMPLLEKEPTNDTLLFYTAMVDIVTDHGTSAVTKLNTVAQGTSIFQSRARWYLFLLFVERGGLAEARAMGLETDSVYGERVRHILSQLGE